MVYISAAGARRGRCAGAERTARRSLKRDAADALFAGADTVEPGSVLSAIDEGNLGAARCEPGERGGRETTGKRGSALTGELHRGCSD
jgi:hypothetical protein